MKCPYCNSFDTELDNESSQYFCNDCGSLISGPKVDKSAAFNDDNAQPELVGRMISALPNKSQNVVISSSDVKIYQTGANPTGKAFQTADFIASKLGIPGHTISVAKRLMNTLYECGDRPSMFLNHLAAICLYISTAKENLPYFLIDFSSILKIPLSSLSNTLNKFIYFYGFKIPELKIETLIDRFLQEIKSKQIELKKDEFKELVLKLYYVMELEGICFGRAQSGIIAALVLIVANHFGIKISKNESAKIGFICKITLLKRIKEISVSLIAELDLELIKKLSNDEIKIMYSGKKNYIEKINEIKEILEFEKIDEVDIYEHLDYKKTDIDEYLDEEILMAEKEKDWDLIFYDWVKNQEIIKNRELESNVVCIDKNNLFNNTIEDEKIIKPKNKQIIKSEELNNFLNKLN